MISEDKPIDCETTYHSMLIHLTIPLGLPFALKYRVCIVLSLKVVRHLSLNQGFSLSRLLPGEVPLHQYHICSFSIIQALQLFNNIIALQFTNIFFRDDIFYRHIHFCFYDKSIQKPFFFQIDTRAFQFLIPIAKVKYISTKSIGDKTI